MTDKHLLAQWAKNLLNDDFFKEVIDNLKKEQISVIINTSAEECDRREDAYRHIKVARAGQGHERWALWATIARNGDDAAWHDLDRVGVGSGVGSGVGCGVWAI